MSRRNERIVTDTLYVHRAYYHGEPHEGLSLTCFCGEAFGTTESMESRAEHNHRKHQAKQIISALTADQEKP